ncbi:MAG: type II secretion system protein GspG [Candidatus Omnitrophota bacterium]
MRRLLLALIMLLSVASASFAQDDVNETLNGLKERTKMLFVKAAKSDVEMTIPMGLELYFMDNGVYPSTEEGLLALAVRPDSAQNWNGPYVRTEKTIIDPWGNPYAYQYPFGDTDGYIVYSFGPDGKKGTKDDIVFKSFEITEEQ